MAGFADIDATTPLGTANANTIDDQIRALKADIIEIGIGAGGLDDGQTTAAHQGMMRFEVASADPTAADRPAGYVYVRTTSLSAQTSRLRRNISSTSWTNIGLWLKELLGNPFSDEGGATEWATESALADSTEATITIEAIPSAPSWYIVDAKTDSANNPTIVLSNPDSATFGSSSAVIFVWIEKNESTGNVELHIYNHSGNTEDIQYAVAQLMWN